MHGTMVCLRAPNWLQLSRFSVGVASPLVRDQKNFPKSIGEVSVGVASPLASGQMTFPVNTGAIYS